MCLVLTVLAGCGGAHPGCPDGEAEAALQAIAEARPEVADIADRMQVFCVDDTTGGCLRDVDGCTVGIGSTLAPGRMVARHGVPLDALVRHEAEHWYLWPTGACPSHDKSCGWRWERVESP